MKRRRDASKLSSGSNQVRIIAGTWRGRKLNFPSLEGLRPTGDRIRETLFNWLAPELPGSRCLDLFCGTGALALESLSRGASSATLLELQPEAAAVLDRHLKTLEATGAELIKADAVSWLASRNCPPFDIVFLDPPFAGQLWQACIDRLENNGWLSESCLIYIEMPAEQTILTPPCWSLHREKKAANIVFRLYRRCGKIADLEG